MSHRCNNNHRQLYFQVKSWYSACSDRFEMILARGGKLVKPEKLYQELKDLAEKIGMRVSEQNFRITTGIRVKSGFCIVKDQECCIIDKHLRLNKKTEALAECISEKLAISQESLETIFLVPAVREYMERFKPVARSETPAEGPEIPATDPSDVPEGQDPQGSN
jgi:translation initiation factor 2 alpha subunit (eIF-2alpha)